MANEVLVGLIAAGSAVAGSAIGAVGAVLAGRFQAQAVRYQTEAQRHAQHEQWLREGMRERYIAVAVVVRRAIPKVLEAQLHMARDENNEARDLLLSIDVSDFERHAAVIRAEAPKAAVEAFQPIAGFIAGIEEQAKRCVDPSVSSQDWMTSSLRDTSAVAENMRRFAAAVRATMRPAGDHEVEGLFFL
ncbi:hypothetical protein [Streptomyces tendae]